MHQAPPARLAGVPRVGPGPYWANIDGPTPIDAQAAFRQLLEEVGAQVVCHRRLATIGEVRQAPDGVLLEVEGREFDRHLRRIDEGPLLDTPAPFGLLVPNVLADLLQVMVDHRAIKHRPGHERHLADYTHLFRRWRLFQPMERCSYMDHCSTETCSLSSPPSKKSVFTITSSLDQELCLALTFVCWKQDACFEKTEF